jgi:precorrin-3B C17-methyltransferase
MSGQLYVIGLGPGNPEQLTVEAAQALQNINHVFGYAPYVNRIPDRPGLTKHISDNREELSRAAQALDLAAAGETVAVVSGGDAGVFGMAAAVCEAIDNGKPEWRAVPMTVLPGISAMLAVSARMGAPLGNDFCVISLSDNLKPWHIIENRLRLAAQAGFAMAFYNPISKARPWQLGQALELLRAELPPQTPVIFGRAAGRTDEHMRVTTISEAQAEWADMATLIIIGTEHTRIIERPNQEPLVYTPRSHPFARQYF